MSNKAETVDNDNALEPKKRSILPWIGAIGGVLSAVVLAWWVGYQVGRDVSIVEIGSLRGKLNKCEKERNEAEFERDSLRNVANDYQIQLSHSQGQQDILPCTLLCSRDAIPILDGEIIVILEGISYLTDYHTSQDLAVFKILEDKTQRSWKLDTQVGYSAEFEHQDEKYTLYFRGFEKRDEKSCAKISVGKKRKALTTDVINKDLR